MVNATFIATIARQESLEAVAGVNMALDATWTMMSGVLVFMMQLGFGLLEAGSIQSINSQSILFKNLIDIAITTLGWWMFGYALYSSTGNAFAGNDREQAASDPSEEWVFVFFNWTFAAASATIVSGAVAGRMRLYSYITVSTSIGWVVFPIVSHWAWASNGWLFERGFIDFAGSGVVHLLGGTAALIACLLVGPRNARFAFLEEEQKWVDRKPRGHSVMMAFIGTVLLWFGWFGFNAGSTLGVSEGRFIVAVTCLFNSSLASSSAIISMTVTGLLLPGKFSLPDVLNAALAGLVAITAGCATTTPWGAIITGLLAAPIYKASAELMAKLRIDDPVDAISVHGTCGLLGVLIPAFFSDQTLIDRAYGEGHIDFRVGHQLGVQVIGLLSIASFAAAFVAIILAPWKFLIPGGIRIDEGDELIGNDFGYFGGYAYPDWEEMVRIAKARDKRRREIQARKEKEKWRKMKKSPRPSSERKQRIELRRMDQSGSTRKLSKAKNRFASGSPRTRTPANVEVTKSMSVQDEIQSLENILLDATQRLSKLKENANLTREYSQTGGGTLPHNRVKSNPSLMQSQSINTSAPVMTRPPLQSPAATNQSDFQDSKKSLL
ncbi:hypothetical protein AAMO2058_001415500 [Amorphochlora amoebiformis]